MKELRAGIIGFGFMGRMHSYGFKTIPLYYINLPYKIKLVGVCDAVEKVAEDAKEQLGFEFATTDPDDIINRDDIDMITVSVPNIYHKDIVVKGLNKGKHVYCDKPLATNMDETQAILDLAGKKKECVTQMALQYRFYTATIRAKQLIEEGRLGRILSFRTVYLHSGSVDPDKPIGWKQDKKFGGGGVLYDLGSHVIDLMYFLLGEYDSIFTETKIIYDKRPDKKGNMIDIEADDMALMIARMKDGSVGTIEASKIATGANDEIRFEIHGVKGSLKFNLMDSNWLEFYDNTLPDKDFGGEKGYTKIECVQRYPKPGGQFPSSKFSIGWVRAHVHCLYNFVDCVYNSKKASPSFNEGAYIQHVMEKAYESDEKKQWIKL